MVECPISAPPPVIAVALPWEAPLSWVVFSVMAVLVLSVLAYVYAQAQRRYHPSVRRHVACSLYAAGVACMLAYGFIFLLVYRPASDRFWAWKFGEDRRFYNATCDLHMLEDTADQTLGMLSSVNEVVLLLIVPSVLLASTGTLLLKGAARQTPVEGVA